MDQHADTGALNGDGMPGAARIEEVITLGNDTARADPSLRGLLRAATQDVHDRLHRHAGFAAIQDATIQWADYRRLLARLYGFYLPFEAAAGIGAERSTWLAADLAALGEPRPLVALPTCKDLPRLDLAHSRLGARYVVEGAALGGRELARGLDRLLGADAVAGRRFFIGRGPGTGEAWRDYLAQLSAAPPEPAARAEIISGAVATFAAFEDWLDGWSSLPNGWTGYRGDVG
jgi:heme oxygenase